MAFRWRRHGIDVCLDCTILNKTVEHRLRHEHSPAIAIHHRICVLHLKSLRTLPNALYPRSKRPSWCAPTSRADRCATMRRRPWRCWPSLQQRRRGKEESHRRRMHRNFPDMDTSTGVRSYSQTTTPLRHPSSDSARRVPCLPWYISSLRMRIQPASGHQ